MAPVFLLHLVHRDVDSLCGTSSVWVQLAVLQPLLFCRKACQVGIPNVPRNYMVYAWANAWAFKGFLYPYFGIYIWAVMIHEPFGNEHYRMVFIFIQGAGPLGSMTCDMLIAC